MTISTKHQITRELARLRMWRDVASEEETNRETEVSHNRINALLDKLDSETLSKALSQSCPTPLTPKS